MNIHTAFKSKLIPIDYDDGAAINPIAVVGGNHPPAEPPQVAVVSGPIDTARGVYVSLAAFLKEFPVITGHDEAKKAANFIEQARATLGEMEDARKQQVTPLNDEVRDINDTYRVPRETIEKVRDEIKRRLKSFADAEEARREREATEARKIAEEAERIAREAEAIERETKADADNGVCDVNVAGAIAQADRAFSQFKRADRAAARAETQIPVRLAGGFGRAVSMRKSETLVLDDAHAAIAAIGLTDTIRDAILSSARAYRKLHGVLPAGVSAETERKF